MNFLHCYYTYMLFRFTLLENFDFYLCLRVKFHKSLFSVRTYFGCWGSLLDPYFKKVGPYFKAWGSLLVSGTVNMEMTRHHHEMKSLGMALLDYCTNG